MNKFRIKLLFSATCLLLTSMPTFADSWIYQVNTNPAPEIFVYNSFNKNEGSSQTYGVDPYGTYLPGFPSLNDNGDVAGRSTYTYIDPYTGLEKQQSESAVWIDGEIHRFGVLSCSTSACQSRALHISNDRNSIVGSSHGSVAGTTPYFERSIVWRVDNYKWLSSYGVLDNVIQSYIEDVNNSGSYVGSSITLDDYVRHAQVVIDGVRYTIGDTYTKSLGVSINNLNQVVGSIVVNNVEKAMIWYPGLDSKNPLQLASYENKNSTAYDINDNQRIVGSVQTLENFSSAAMWVDYSLEVLGTLGGKNSVARAINNSNVVVGYSEVENGEKHAFVYSQGVMHDLNNLIDSHSDWTIVDAYDVNESGQILVRAINGSLVSANENAYWLLSPEDFTPGTAPEMLNGNAGCQWGQENCDMAYPPKPATNAVYQMPSGPLPDFNGVQIPFADAYVCNTLCENYTQFTPMFSTISEAVAHTSSNSTILVFPGEYIESVILSSKKLIGLAREYTIINANGLNSRVVSLQGNSILSGLAITGGNAFYGGGVQVSGGNNLIENCIIQGNTATYDGGGVHGLMYSAFDMRNSIISQNKAMYGGGYVSWSYGSARIEHSQFLNNKANFGAGVFFASYASVYFNANVVDKNSAIYDGGGVYVNGYTKDIYIRNSLITNNHAGRYAGGVYRGGLLGSVVYGNSADVKMYSAIYFSSAQNSIIWGNAGTYATVGIRDSIVEGNMPYCSYCTNVIKADPLFVDASNGDFRLQANSPAIDAGSDTTKIYGQWQFDDFNGVQRGIDGDGNGVSSGNDFDIGAFEYIPQN